MYKPQIKNLISVEKGKNEKKKDNSNEKYVPVKQSAVLPTEEKQKRKLERQN